MNEEYFNKYLDQRFANIEGQVASIREDSRQLREDFGRLQDAFGRAAGDIKAMMREQQAETRNIVNQKQEETRAQVEGIRTDLRSTIRSFVQVRSG